MMNNTIYSTRLGLKCQTPVKVKPLPLPSEALFSPSKDCLSLKFMLGPENVRSEKKNCAKTILWAKANFGSEKI